MGPHLTLHGGVNPWAVLSVLIPLGLIGFFTYTYFSSPPKVTRIALMYVRPADKNDKEAANVARSIESEVEYNMASSGDIRWISREGIVEAFRRQGVSHADALEKLEPKACDAARSVDLDFGLVGRLQATGNKGWKLSARIVCTNTVQVVGTLTCEGKDAPALVQQLLANVRDWTAKNL